MTNVSEKTYDVVAIGNALVDVSSQVDDAVLAGAGIEKGGWAKVTGAEEAKALHGLMGETAVMSAGSAANTLYGMAKIGSKNAFIGKVCDDEWGEQIRHDFAHTGVGIDFNTPCDPKFSRTGQCFIYVSTQDGERTMRAYLGPAGMVEDKDIDAATIGRSKILFTEAYMWDEPCAKQALRHAFSVAKAAGTKVAFTLSAAGAVARNREEIMGLIAHDIDILLCNEEEAIALFADLDPKGKDSFTTAMGRLSALQKEGHCPTMAITRGNRGSFVLEEGKPPVQVPYPYVPAGRVVDKTGAGDAFAAGFLYGQTHGMKIRQSALLGGFLAADAVQQHGPRTRFDKTGLDSALATAMKERG